MKEYTVNLDVQVFAKNIEKAIAKLSQVIGDNKFRYWIGEVKEAETKNEKKV